MTDICREFGILRKTGYKLYQRYRAHGLEALSDGSRRPVRAPEAGEIALGARKIRELLVCRLDGAHCTRYNYAPRPPTRTVVL